MGTQLALISKVTTAVRIKTSSLADTKKYVRWHF